MYMQNLTLQTEENLAQAQVESIPATEEASVSFMERITPKFARDARRIFKEGGFRAVVKRYGWRVFAAFFIYYLIRDSILYLLIPYLIARGLMT